MSRKLRITLTGAMPTLAAMSALDSASADLLGRGGWFLFGEVPWLPIWNSDIDHNLAGVLFVD